MKFGTKIGSAGPAPLLREQSKDAEAAHMLAEDQSHIEAEHLKNEVEQADADRRSADAEAAKATEQLGTMPTTAIPSTNPPPPKDPAPTPIAATTQEVDAYMKEFNASEAREAEAAKRAEAVTGDMPVVTTPPAAASAPPEPPQWGRSQPRVAMPAVTEQQVRFSENLPRNVFGTIVVLFACVLAVVFAGGVYYGLSHAMPSFDTLAELANPATNGPVTATPAAPNPAPVPHGLLPPPEPTWVEPGLRGAHGTRVRMSAQAAFPVRCTTALTANWPTDVRFLCGVGQRSGDNLCGCVVTGLVP